MKYYKKINGFIQLSLIVKNYIANSSSNKKTEDTGKLISDYQDFTNQNNLLFTFISEYIKNKFDDDEDKDFINKLQSQIITVCSRIYNYLLNNDLLFDTKKLTIDLQEIDNLLDENELTIYSKHKKLFDDLL